MKMNSSCSPALIAAALLVVAGCDNAGRIQTGTATPVSGLRINDTAVVEGDTGMAQMRFHVTVPAPVAEDISFEYATSDGSAIAGEDYVAVTGSGTIPAGARHTTLVVDVIGDDDSHVAFGGKEADEFFTLTLSNVSANVASVALDSASGTIENDEGFVAYTAAVITVAPDFSSGAHSLIRNDGGTLSALNDLAPTHSDLNIAVAGQKAYRIERFDGANVAKFDRDDDIASPEWQYSVRDPGDSAARTNPRTLAVANSGKAYLTRYEKNTAWIVNPAATRFAQFKLGELDLSAYADADGIVEMGAAVIGAGRLFIAMQRLDRDAFFAPDNTAYIAVFDIETDQEIDTGRDPTLRGIPLTIRNPNRDLVVVAAENALYVQGVGDFLAASSGGVERIDLDTYASRVVVDDDAPGSAHGKTSALAVVSPNKGYLVGYAGFGDTTLFTFDPASATVGPPVAAAFTGIDIAGISIGPAGNLWISDASNATVHVLDTATDAVIGSVVTNLNPQQLDFFTAP